jgi:hypothetical protein
MADREADDSLPGGTALGVSRCKPDRLQIRLSAGHWPPQVRLAGGITASLVPGIELASRKEA